MGESLTGSPPCCPTYFFQSLNHTYSSCGSSAADWGWVPAHTQRSTQPLPPTHTPEGGEGAGGGGGERLGSGLGLLHPLSCRTLHSGSWSLSFSICKYTLQGQHRLWRACVGRAIKGSPAQPPPPTDPLLHSQPKSSITTAGLASFLLEGAEAGNPPRAVWTL